MQKLRETHMSELVGSYMAYTKAMQESGVYVAGDRLQPTASATTVRVADGRSQVLLRRGEQFERQPEHPLAAFGDVEFAAWGDLDNDGLTDVLLCRAGASPLLVHQSARGRLGVERGESVGERGRPRVHRAYGADVEG